MNRKIGNFNLALKNYEHLEGVKVQSKSEDCSASICQFDKAFNYSCYIEHACIKYTIQGSKCVMVNNRIFYLNEGDLIYIPKNSIVFLNIENCKIPFKGFDIEMVPEKLEKYFNVKKNNYLNLTAEPFVIYNDLKIRTIFNNFLKINCLENNELGYHKLLNSLIEILAPTVFIINSKSNIINDNASIIYRMIINTLYDNLTIEQMAFQCNMSLASFKRNFKAEFGIAPKKWVRNIRLQTAYFNLKTNKMNVSEAAYLTGFNSLPHFSFSFKKEFSISPSSLLSSKTELNSTTL